MGNVPLKPLAPKLELTMEVALGEFQLNVALSPQVIADGVVLMEQEGWGIIGQVQLGL